MPYQDEQIKNWQLKIGFWFTVHRLQFKKFFYAFLFFLDIFLVIYPTYRIILFYSSEKVEYEKMITQLVQNSIDFKSYHEKNRPSGIVLSEIDALRVSENRYSFIAKVVNPNKEKWVLEEITYFFELGGFKTEKRKSFLLPGEEKFLTSLNTEVEGGGIQGQPIIHLEDIKWLKINAKDKDRFEKIMEENLNFDIRNIKFLGAPILDISGKKNVSSVKFKVINETIFSYYDVKFLVALYSSSSIIGVNYVILDNFLSGETREAEVRFFGAISYPTKIVVLPEVNVLNPDSYIKPGKRQGIPK